jgi:ketosteroid isomerase-like protein
MSRENVELVRGAFESFASDGLTRSAESYLAPDAEYVEDPVWPGASTYEGRDEVVACFRAYTEALGREEDWSITVERVFEAGERLVPFVRFASAASASGVPHDHLWAYVVEVRDGRIAYLRAYYDPQEALEAVGLSE